MLKHLAASAPGSKLLEVGCSYGFFLANARMHGWDATGIEISDKAATFGRSRGLNIHTGTLDDAHVSSPYDVIVAFDVIEHLVSPMRFLAQCRNLLREDGILMFSTANVASWIAKATGKYWTWHSPPAHIYLFTPEALKRAIAKSSFRLERLWTHQGDANSNLYEYLSALARRWRQRNNGNGVSSAPLTHRPAVRFVRAAIDIAYSPLAVTIDPWLAKRNLQPEVVVIARNS
jgi:cyclopropane fatty-acyl-phospholipid synthase-like methyltransferase